MIKILKLHQQYKKLLLYFPLMFNRTDFKNISQRNSFPEDQEATLKYWTENKCFDKQLELTKNLPPYTFYDGPPFATGTPHYGHIAAGTIKDVVCRYATQTGHYVSRRFGWDCHGLPVQYEIDKQLKITDKKQVLQMGIAKYNNQCRSIVMKYSHIWQSVVNRFGRWIDFKNDYKTLDINFMESVWYVFKQLFNKGLVYRGRKIMPYSNGCTTVLSNFQVQQNYKQVSDPSLYVNFPLVKDPNVKFMVWTTTPWTLPSNLALAVSPNMQYVKIKDTKKNQVYIMAQCRLKHFYGKDKKGYEIIQKMKGTDLAGTQYVPIFDFFAQRAKDGCFKVLIGDFVTDDSGTGIVHCAPGFGQEDYKICVSNKIIDPDNPPVPLDQNGKFTKQVPTYEGVYVKDADNLIIKELKERGRLVQSGKQIHNYPFCWRSDTPLIYKAVSTWFIRVTDFKQDLVKNNHKAYWVPQAIQQKRFDNWLKDAKDWCFSRNRYWGNPIPLWVSQDGQEIVCVGSVKELEQLTGQKVTDLHRQHIDHLTIQSKQGKGKLRRIQQVFDCWFESGSMPYAQVHYPFSTNEEQFSKIFPADFIGEGIDQTRGWFYTLNVLATGIKNMNPYKNLIVNGLVLTEDGKKMSKRLKNYPDPVQVANQFGADAVRLYLINSPLVRADNLNFSKEGVKSVVKQIFLPWYNAYKFLIQNISKYETRTNESFTFVEDITLLTAEFNVTDKWILSALQILIKNVRKQMGDYKLYNVAPQLIKFLEYLTNWYVRLNRNRLKGQISDSDMKVSINILFDVLFKVNTLMSPIVPFLTQNMYQNMKLVINKQSKLRQDSIHHVFIAEVNQKLIDQQITQQMQNVMRIIETGRKLRENKKISLKQPIMSLTVVNKSQKLFEQLSQFLPYIQDQINVASIKNETDINKYIRLQALPNLPVLGLKFKGNKNFKNIQDEIKKLTTEQLSEFRQTGSVVILQSKIELVDILLLQKFVVDNIKEHEVIGGEHVIVMLDTRQDQELRIRGFGRQLINRIQKLKKKAHLKTEDQVLIFYKISQNAKNLTQTLVKQGKNIQNAVKKPLYPMSKCLGLVHIDKDSGLIQQQQYELLITHPHAVFNHQALFNDFGKAGKVLAQTVLSMPFQKVRNQKQFKLRLDEKDYVLLEGKHYQFLK